MVSNESFIDAHQHLNDADAILKGVLAIMDDMEEEFARDARGYALLAALQNASAHLTEASDLLDKYVMDEPEL